MNDKKPCCVPPCGHYYNAHKEKVQASRKIAHVSENKNVFDFGIGSRYNEEKTVQQPKGVGKMTAYAKLSPEQLQAEYEAVSKAFEAVKSKNLKLDMSRGKPGVARI